MCNSEKYLFYKAKVLLYKTKVILDKMLSYQSSNKASGCWRAERSDATNSLPVTILL